ncbi:MAG: GAF domain-containing protein [Bacteroidales bacterium]|jgi:methyl-accepting chemotaxis protein|nr:GAF domain-containing protein [Bacteroidales bacterium]HOA09043.1 GAF domain-containing protein [Tenuifilaceae bacterium]MBP8642885.1 GAF domain-containing protein [Bacteroidales bacterium]HOC35837.1 GAF domain-containing protein [Tenuifilaceae bacterium]HOG71377.1 GAF domain-containing protein [Tenuifilaceae bacterium]
MKVRLKLRSKLLLSVLSTAIVVFLVSFGYLTNKLEDITLRSAFRYVDATTREHSNAVKANFDEEMGMARAMAQGFQNYKDLNYEEINKNSLRVLQGIAVNNPQFLSVWASWELNSIDRTWDKPYGRVRYTYFWENGALKYVEDRVNLTGDDPNSSYYHIKSTKREFIIEPYWFTYTGTNMKVLETSICVPLVDNDRFVALFGFDIELERYHEFIDSVEIFPGSNSMLISQDGLIVAHSDSSLTGIRVDSIFNQQKIGFNIIDKLKKESDFSFNVNMNGSEYYASFQSFAISGTTNRWTFASLSPLSIIVEESKDVATRSRIVILAGLLILALVVWIISYSITHPLVKATRTLRELAGGEIDTSKKLAINSGDEVEDIGSSINILIDSLYKTTNFAREIGKGNFNVDYSKLSENDKLGEALLDMRKSLEHARLQEVERKLGEDKNRWANEGVAKFAEILRQNSDDLNEFCYSFIYNLVKYVDANIGAIYLVNNDNPNEVYFELMATYAYERRKYEEKRIDFGEGLVGRCAKEAETIYMTDLPKDYIKISSGLGEESPTCLLLVPIKLNENVHGVIEMASFEPIEDYKIRFIEKIGESLAATISNVKINIRTGKLLDESRVKSEELASQEEEMRQNMEELQATQEEAARKTAEMESLIGALHASSFVIEYDLNGNITSVNQAYLTLTGQSENEVIGTHHSDNLEMTDEQKKNYQKFWNDLRNGMVKKETSRIKLGKKTLTFIETYSPIFNQNRQVVKILKIAHNITDFIEDEKVKGRKTK